MTTDVRAGRPTGPLLPVLTQGSATPRGERATFRGLCYEPDRNAAVRTNIGLLNLRASGLRVVIEAFDSRERPLGSFRGRLPARGFVQLDDIFRPVEAGPVAGGSAVVEALEEGDFLSYASVVRGPAAPAVDLFPEPPPAVR